MQSANMKEIKVALWRQAFIGDTWVSCGMGQVVAIRRHKEQLLAMIRGWKPGAQLSMWEFQSHG